MNKICNYCNKEFVAERAFQKFCFVNCRVQFNARKRAGIKKCQECDREFQPSSSKVIFCSTSCSSKNRHRYANKTITCIRCGAQFEFKGTTSAKYCSKCRKQVDSEKTTKSKVKLGIQTLNNVGVGIGGWQSKGDNSTTRSYKGIHQREKVYLETCLTRFKGIKKCIVCSDEENIQVHHIDHNPLNNSPDNLVFLCRSCHTLHHKKKILTTDHILSCIKI